MRRYILNKLTNDQEFIASIKGKPGADGKSGRDGKDGKDGKTPVL